MRKCGNMGQRINGRAQEDLMRHYLADMSSQFAFVFFVKNMPSRLMQSGSSGAAVWGIAVICALETSARKQKARGFVDVCKVEKIFFSPRFARTDDA